MSGTDRRELLRWLARSAAGAGLAPAAACFAQTASALPPFIFTRDDARFEALRAGYNKRLSFLPKYIAACTSTQEVQAALQLASEQDLPVAIRSGGHCFEGFSSNNGGLVINVSRMKTVQWQSKENVTIGAGCVLAEIQSALFARRRLLPSGSCGSVGISGLTLGGGYGFFSRSHGLTCDNLLGLSLVTPDGREVDTDHDPELLWACRGGGLGNFGVVTALRFRTQPMPPRFDSQVLRFRNLDSSRFSELLTAWFSVSKTLPNAAFSAFVLNGRTLTVLITSHDGAVDLASLAAPLRALATQVEPLLKTPLPQAMPRYHGRKGSINFKNASAGLYRGLEDLLPLAEQLFEQVVAARGVVFQINTLGGRIADPAFAQGSCYPHRHLPYLGELQAYWERPQDAPRLIATFEGIQGLFRKQGITAHYVNYPDLGFTDWEQSYYGDHYARLQAVKQRYDPHELLRYPQGVKPAAGKA